MLVDALGFDTGRSGFVPFLIFILFSVYNYEQKVFWSHEPLEFIKHKNTSVYVGKIFFLIIQCVKMVGVFDISALLWVVSAISVYSSFHFITVYWWWSEGIQVY